MSNRIIFCNSKDEIEEVLGYKDGYSDVISSNEKIPTKGIAFISFDTENIHYIMAFKKSGRIATKIDRISFIHPIYIDKPIKLDDIKNTVDSKVKCHFERQINGRISLLSDKVEKSLLKFIKKNRPSIFKKINELILQIENKKPSYSPKQEEIIAQEKDAVSLALKIFSFDEAIVPSWSSDNNTAPFLKGYNSVTIREDPMINHDSQIFGDWKKIGQFVQGAVEFQKEDGKLTIMNVNRQPLEKTLGVDLLIYHHTYNSYLLIQYKRMTKEAKTFAYRPTDASYLSEIKRMNIFMDTLNRSFTASIKNFRLNDEFFYFKLCPARIQNLNTLKMMPGMYIPLSLWNILLIDDSTNGSKGGKIISYENNKRYITNSQFIDLVQNGWIGSHVESSEKITEIIQNSINSDNSLMLAKYDNNDTQSNA